MVQDTESTYTYQKVFYTPATNREKDCRHTPIHNTLKRNKILINKPNEMKNLYNETLNC